MKIIILFALPILLTACVYDPPTKGKSIGIHNQTDSDILVLDSLKNDANLNLYDTAKVNSRMYISRKYNYITEYNNFIKFLPDAYIQELRKDNRDKLSFYFIKKINLEKPLNEILVNHLYRSTEINLDTLEKYGLNHLFILLEHDHNFITNWKHELRNN
jgi:hypothetical protein